MSEVKAGRACVFGIDGTITYSGKWVTTATPNSPTSMATSQMDMQSAGFNDQFEVTTLPNSSGEIIGKNARNRTQTLSIDLFILAASGVNTDADAQAAIKLPDPLAIVTLAGFNNTTFDGDWNYEGPGAVNMTADGYARVSLTLSRVGGEKLSIIS